MWIRAFANDLGRLAQGAGTRMPSGTNTVFFVLNFGILIGRVVTYAQLAAALLPHTSEVHRVRCTVGGEKLNFLAKPPPTALV